MELVTGNIINTERKFIIDDEKVRVEEPAKWIKSLSDSVESYIINQFYVDGIKYREIMVEDEDKDEGEGPAIKTVGYTKNIKNGNITNVTEITPDEYDSALEKTYRHHSSKNRDTYIKDGFHIDIDTYFTTDLTLIEVSGDNLEKFVPPEFLKEVTGDENYSAKKIFEKEMEWLKTRGF